MQWLQSPFSIENRLSSSLFAEFVQVADDAIDAKPANLMCGQATAVPLAGGTALLGLRQAGV